VRQPNLPAWSTNDVAMSLAPIIGLSSTTASAGTINLTVTCAPRLRDGQRVLLVFGNRQILPQTITTPADTTKPSTIAFTIPGVTAGTYVVRLRIDGVDSIPIAAGKTPSLGFDPAQQVKVT
jgi:hypothetical protein